MHPGAVARLQQQSEEASYRRSGGGGAGAGGKENVARRLDFLGAWSQPEARGPFAFEGMEEEEEAARLQPLPGLPVLDTSTLFSPLRQSEVSGAANKFVCFY